MVIANGVTITGATINVKGKVQGTLTPGTVLTVISNTSADPISGTFSNLADGAIITSMATISWPVTVAAMGMISH